MEQKLFDSEFMKKLENLCLNSRLAMNAGATGSRKSKAKGSSVEFSDYREYATGDDFRRIDWNAYGRFDKLFVKLFTEEREAVVNIFIDSSKSMDFGEKNKSYQALRLAAVFAYLSLNNLDRVCINSMKGSELLVSDNFSGRASFQRCIEKLMSVDFSGSTSLKASIKKKEFKNRGISIIFSDFFSDDSIEETIKYLMYKNQEVILVHILCEEELNPSYEGQISLIDSETGIPKNVAMTPIIIKQYEKKLNSFINGIKEFSSKVGASYCMISSSDSLEKVVFEKLNALCMGSKI